VKVRDRLAARSDIEIISLFGDDRKVNSELRTLNPYTLNQTLGPKS